MSNESSPCTICDSKNLTRFNSYKHHCYVCNDCHTVFHKKKEGRYFLEYFLPRGIFKNILPRQAFLRLFRDLGDYNSEDFYDTYATECAIESDFRISEVSQLIDQLYSTGIALEGKSILDISGGPGLVAKYLSKKCKRFVVTEYSEISVRAMSDILGVNAVTFDYTKDRIDVLFKEKFDIILIRSSIIFCPNLNIFIQSLRKILNPEGYVLLETILPTLGEVFWWQQMEYKFPFIYSQETLEKYFYKFGFSLKYGDRAYGSYTSIKRRGTKTLARKIFTWLIDYPMVLAYYYMAPKRKIPIDHKLHHKMLTQIWH